MTLRPLDDHSKGRWLVQTSASTYLFDMDERSVMRTPGSVTEWPVTELRRDGEAVALRQILYPARVGWPLTLRVDVREDGVETLRQTTPVVSFHQEGQAS